jgi:phosphoenolpyruvate synthase/pyruvate phosphate dikinase
VLVNKTTNEVIDVSKTCEILSKEEIVRLAKVGILVEDSLKEGPQDIEWAVEKGSSIFYLLQTRQLI